MTELVSIQRFNRGCLLVLLLTGLMAGFGLAGVTTYLLFRPRATG